MCELFAMSCRVPSAVTYSMHEFAKHGEFMLHLVFGAVLGTVYGRLARDK